MKSLFPLIALLLGLASCSTQENIRPNILLILSDDHSLPHLGAYGDKNCLKYNITPNLDKFAKLGMLFERAYTAAPQCHPSRNSIFTGRSPVGTSTTRFNLPPSKETVYFTDFLRQHGYWTATDGRHQHLDGKLKGKEPAHVEKTMEALGIKGPEFENRFDSFVSHWNTKGENLKKVPDRLNAFLDAKPTDKPFFLYFGFNQPHRPLKENHYEIDPKKLTLPADWPDTPEVRLDYARFLGEVRDMDKGFGSLMEVLEKRKLFENTIVIFMGDNGEALLRGKGTLYTRGINVPLIIRWPGKVKAHSISKKLVSGVDLATTLLAAVGIKKHSKMTGINILSEETRKYVFSERSWHYGPISRTDGFDLSRSITSDRYHFIYNATPEKVISQTDMAGRIAWKSIQKAHSNNNLSKLHQRLYFQNPRPIFELYNLKNDPLQIENLAGKKELSTIENELRKELDKWMIRERDYLPLPADIIKITAREKKKDTGNKK